MSIVHLVQQLHLGSCKLPAQQLVCCVLLQVVLVHCLGNDCTILVETPSQQYLNQSCNPQHWVMHLKLLTEGFGCRALRPIPAQRSSFPGNQWSMCP